MKQLLVILSLCATQAFGQSLHEVVNFETNASALSKVEKDKLLSFISRVKGVNDYSLTVFGHTDSIGTFKFNESLSAKRANAVFKFLVENGMNKDKIAIDYFGKTKPVVSNETETARHKNRRVEIAVTFAKASAGKASEDSVAEVEKFENDTTITLPGGTKILIDAETFFPRKIKEINLNAEEVFSNCDMVRKKIKTQTENGDCLTSGGMIFFRPTVDMAEVQPNKGKKVKIKIPAPKNMVDKEMKIYTAVRDKGGNIKWRLTKSELSYELAGTRYYVFEVESLDGINIDKPVKVRCEENGPVVKVKKYRNVDMYLTYPDELYLSEGFWIKNKLYSLPQVNEEKSPQLTIVAYDRHGNSYVAKGPLLNLTKIKKNKVYLVRKKYFKPVEITAGTRTADRERAVCQALNQ